MDDWQTLDDDNVDPTPKPVSAAAVNKWAGEDEDEVKDSWDAEEEDEKKDEEKIAPAPSKKKTLSQKIAEKERLAEELDEQKLKEKEEEENLTPEEVRARKLLQEEADTIAALATLGLAPSDSDFNPSSVDEFKVYAEAFSRKVTEFKRKDDLFPVLEELVKNLCAGMSSLNIRKVKTGLDVLHTEKVKLEKADKNKKKPGAKAAGKLRMERDDDYSSRAGAFEADDYDDFM